MTDDERDDLLSAMYGDAEDGEQEPRAEVAAAPIAPPGDSLRGKKVLIHGKFVDIPHMEYVFRLEKALADQSKIISRLDRDLSALRTFVKRQTGTLRELSQDMNNKIDRRD